MIAIRRFDEEAAWIAALIDDMLGAVLSAESENRRAVICLAGGSTPRPVYTAASAALAASPALRAGPVALVIGDERAEPRSPSERNETMIRAAFSAAVGAGAAEIVGWSLEGGPDGAVAAMAAAMRRLRAARPVGSPSFDRCYLGLGADGHTAGVFPGTPAALSSAVAVACLALEEPRARVSLSLPTLASTRGTRFIVRAAGKEGALRRLAAGDPGCPAVAAAAPDAVAFVLGRA